MSTNDFLPFAAGTGANVQTQADYNASSDRATGYVTGTASSAEVNKVLRQCSLIASMVAQLIVDKTGQNAVDDGTIATLEANLEQAILNIAANRIIQISDVVNLTTTLAGKLDTTGNAASASRLAIARAIALTGIISGSVNFDGSSNVSINTSIADAVLSIAKTSGLQAALDAKTPLSAFQTASYVNGVVTRFPDGTIIARGVMPQSSSSITFPTVIPFTSAPVVTATPVNSGNNPNGYSMAVGVPTTTSVPVHQNYPLSIYWHAIGR